MKLSDYNMYNLLMEFSVYYTIFLNQTVGLYS